MITRIDLKPSILHLWPKQAPNGMNQDLALRKDPTHNHKLYKLTSTRKNIGEVITELKDTHSKTIGVKSSLMTTQTKLSG